MDIRPAVARERSPGPSARPRSGWRKGRALVKKSANANGPFRGLCAGGEGGTGDRRDADAVLDAARCTRAGRRSRDGPCGSSYELAPPRLLTRHGAKAKRLERIPCVGGARHSHCGATDTIPFTVAATPISNVRWSRAPQSHAVRRPASIFAKYRRAPRTLVVLRVAALTPGDDRASPNLSHARHSIIALE